MLIRRILIVLAITLLTFLSGNVISQTASNGNLPDYPSGSQFELTPWPHMPDNRNPAQQDFERFQMEMQRNMRSMNNMDGMNPEERIRQMQKQAQEQEEQAMKQALRVDERQWKDLKPKIEKVQKYKKESEVSIGIPFNSSFSSTSNFSGGFQVGFSGGGGFANTSMPNMSQPSVKVTKGERICQELQMLLDSTPVSGQTQVSQRAIQAKIKELQQARAEAKKQLVKAQEELKKGLDLQLQARLILLGLLD